MQYQISRWDSQTAMKARDHSNRVRLDAALNDLWRMIYEMLHGESLLDRPVAKRLEKEFADYAAKLEREGLKPGHFRSDTFYLRERDSLSPHVTFSQRR